jgi:hypothetical protein
LARGTTRGTASFLGLITRLQLLGLRRRRYTAPSAWQCPWVESTVRSVILRVCERSLGRKLHAPKVHWQAGAAASRLEQEPKFGGETLVEIASVSSSDEKVANRDTKVWHGATENGP